mmetsp:Transcript_891/g.3329  ORF Transcript_891/g.3329 Transcript_891/m.3329 type:complete len:232 (+) Transcript_891:131-826(+)
MMSQIQLGIPSSKPTTLSPALTKGSTLITSGSPLFLSSSASISSPTTPDLAAFTEYWPMHMIGSSGMGGREGSPTEHIRCSSTRSTPHTSRFMSLTGPPPILLFTSISCGPLVVVYLSSTCITPLVSPMAFSIFLETSTSSSCFRRGRSDGVTAPVSLNQGSSVGRLSVTLAYVTLPSLRIMSTSTSSPSRYCSIITSLTSLPSSPAGSEPWEVPWTSSTEQVRRTSRTFA